MRIKATRSHKRPFVACRAVDVIRSMVVENGTYGHFL